MTDLTPRSRLELIVKANRHCNEIVTRESLRSQFRYETGVEPDQKDMDAVLRAFAKEVAGGTVEKE